jgi:ribosome-binding protein aMBF1 (putative translation factor)
MRCTLCKKELPLFEGIYDTRMIMVCEVCAEEEGIPLLRKPSSQQIERSKESLGVRERMERMSGMRRDTTPISDEQAVVQSALSRLKAPVKKEQHPEVLDNYYWQVNISRRRKKMTLSQVAEQTGISSDVLESIERGQIPEDFQSVFLRLESFFGVKLLKVRPAQVLTVEQRRDNEEDILASVREKMDLRERGVEPEVEKVVGRSRGESSKSVDSIMSKPKGEFTLNDAIERKKRFEVRKRHAIEKSKSDSLIGEEIDLDLDEV